MGASSRYRTLQYLPAYRAAGIDPHVAPLLTDKYLKGFYGDKKKPVREVLAGYGRRIADLVRSREFDLIVIEKEALPFVSARVERSLLGNRTPVVLDYDDAIFHRYDRSGNRWVRAFLKNKIRHVMKAADCVIVGNEYLADYAKGSGSKRVEVVPTVVDLERYPRGRLADPSSVHPFTVGWIGSPTTAKFLELLGDPLKRLGEGAPMKLLSVGSGPLEIDGVLTEDREWSPDREMDDLRSMSVGVMPLLDNPWERGKCGLKLIQYMAAGLPVVASPVGMNKDIVQEGKNGFLARTPDDWVESLQALRDDRELAEKMGQMGRKLVEEKFSLQAMSQKMVSILKSVVDKEEG